MKIETIIVSPFEQNARIIICEKTHLAVLLDPGDETQRILDTIQKLQVKIEYILATHGHIDHIGAVADIQKKLNVPFLMHHEDQFLAGSIAKYGKHFGMEHVTVPSVSRYIQDKETISVGDITFQVIHAPGHSPGSVCYYTEEDIFVGDVLFDGSIGRSDLPGGSFEILENSIRTRLYTLPPSTRVHPGHGGMTTIGKEKESNPFIHE